MLAFFVFLRITTFPKVVSVLRSSISMQSVKQLEREEFNPFNPTSFALSLLFVLMLSFFLYKANNEFQQLQILNQKSDLIQFAFFILCVCIFLPIKFGIRKVVGHISNEPALTNEIFYNNLVINQSLGILLLPIMIIIEFSHLNPVYLLVSTGIIITTSLFIKLYRGVVFSLFENRIGLLQVFIYLCALEILPFLVFLKFIMTNF
ncbi:MAG: DUF4271 domain-containing protein [Sphingobacteriaceae bacterium]|nr:DUF4271 domain-containing protein [Sphingobacteriaceae bacterium]